MASPDSGTSTTTTVSAAPVISNSVCPTPTVSTSTRSNPNPSIRSITSRVVVASPPSEPRVAIERMKVPGSVDRSVIRIRSPSSAPPEKGEVGSTATTPTRSPAARYAAATPASSVDFPAPGGPVNPSRRALGGTACSASWRNASNPSRSFSTTLIARASATRSRCLKDDSRGARRSGSASTPAALTVTLVRPDAARVTQRILQQVRRDEEYEDEQDQRQHEPPHQQPFVVERDVEDRADQRRRGREDREQHATRLEVQEALVQREVSRMHAHAQLLAVGTRHQLAQRAHGGLRLLEEVA